MRSREQPQPLFVRKKELAVRSITIPSLLSDQCLPKYSQLDAGRRMLTCMIGFSPHEVDHGDNSKRQLTLPITLSRDLNGLLGVKGKYGRSATGSHN